MSSVALAWCVTLSALAAGPDNNVEWNGVSHVWFQDRRPLCPLDGESFIVQFQTYLDDLTSACVWVDDGIASPTCINAVVVDQRGPYDVWEAPVPATMSDIVTYYLELADGTDTDYYGINGMSDTEPAGAEFIIDYATLSHAPYGSTPHPDGGTVFRVWAPTPTSAHVRGEFNAWGLADAMTPLGDDFVMYVPGAEPGDMYKFYFEPGAVWKPDARARALNPADNYNAIIQDPLGYQWNDQEWVTPPFEEMIIYELHVGTFSGRNDGGTHDPATYRDVVDLHLDHLVELGINAVELMPPTEFPWDWSAGYNPVTAYAPEWKLGTPDDLKYMIDVLHQNGIAVLIDNVWNHFSSSDNYLWEYDGDQIYFDDPAVETPWGSQADFDRPEVQDYFADSALYWLEEFHVDGFRMDATEFMNLYQGSGWGLMQRMNDEIDNRYTDKIAIAEQLPDDDWVTRPTDIGGAGFDAQWFDTFTDDIRQAIFDAAFGNPSMTKVRDAILGSGIYLSGPKVVNYIESHDDAWPENGGERMVITIDPSDPHDDIYAQSRTKMGHALAMFAPGIPMFLQGCEFLEDTNFGSNAPGTDEARLDWTKPATYSGYFQYFKDMIAIRKENDALRADSSVNVSHLNDTDNVIGFHRYNGFGNDIFVLVSFKNGDLFDYQIGLPLAGTWTEILNSQADVYGGTGLGNGGSITTVPEAKDGFADSATITVPQMSVLVFKFGEDDPEPCDGDANGDNAVDPLDSGYVLARFGCPVNTGGADCDAADQNGDGAVDPLDVGYVLARFGACE